jgi:hypothetical protein
VSTDVKIALLLSLQTTVDIKKFILTNNSPGIKAIHIDPHLS